MARRDIIHDAVRTALEADDWIITDDPFFVKIEGSRGVEIDLGAEKFIAAQKADRKIAPIVIGEIKSFIGSSILNNFHEALGQYLDYRDALEENQIERVLYLAVSKQIYSQIEVFPFIMRRIEKYGLKLIVVTIEQQQIIKWRE